MSLHKFSRLLYVKYAVDINNSNISISEKEVRDDIAGLYRKFMPEFDKAIFEIKQSISLVNEVYNLTSLDESFGKIKTAFSFMVENIDTIKTKDLVFRIMEIVDLIQNGRENLINAVKTNKDNPAFTGFSERKRLSSTIDKVLTEFSYSLLKCLKKLNGFDWLKSSLPSPTEALKSRKRMTQTPEQIKMLVFKFGDLYGVEDMLDYGQIVHKDSELAYELMTAFLGLNRASRQFTKQEYFDPKDNKHKKKELEFLRSKVKLDLKEKILKLLGKKG